MTNRRTFLLAGASGLLIACAPDRKGEAASPGERRFADSPFRKLSEDDWRKRLAPEAFAVLRQEHTEAPGSSALEAEARRGTYVCAGCELPLFKSEWKYHSGSGWPSFSRAWDANLGTKRDIKLFVPRTEYHCARCLGHQGHIFDDGPPPTGLRYCNNGVALKFVPA